MDIKQSTPLCFQKYQILKKIGIPTNFRYTDYAGSPAKESDQGKEDIEDSEDEGSRREEEGSSGEEEESRGSRREELKERRDSRPGNRKLTGFHVFCAREREQVGREKPRLVQGRGKGRWGLGRELARR